MQAIHNLTGRVIGIVVALAILFLVIWAIKNAGTIIPAAFGLASNIYNAVDSGMNSMLAFLK